MKNQPFLRRLGYSLTGIASAFRSEASFRTQCVFALGAVGVLLYFKAEPAWWAIFAVVIGGVLSAELMNTALEHVVDRLHPEKHASIASAKDCAAGAVLVLSLAALGVLIAFLASRA